EAHVTDPGTAADPLPTRWILLLGVAAAAIAALTISAQIYLSMRDHSPSAVKIFAWQLAGWGFWALLAPTVLRLAGRLRREGRGLPRRVPSLLVVGLLMIAAHIVVISQLPAWIQPFVPSVTYGFREAL